MSRRTKWRALVRVELVSATSGTFQVVVPGWSSGHIFELPLESVPEEVRAVLAPGKRLHARVNLGAVEASEIRFDGWELR